MPGQPKNLAANSNSRRASRIERRWETPRNLYRVNRRSIPENDAMIVFRLQREACIEIQIAIRQNKPVGSNEG
jgi:hypothetical protein